MGGEKEGLALTTFHFFNHQEGRGCVICFSIGWGGGTRKGRTNIPKKIQYTTKVGHHRFLLIFHLSKNSVLYFTDLKYPLFSTYSSTLKIYLNVI